jgi:hypothetical protein
MPKYQKSKVLEERKTMSQLNESRNLEEGSQQGVPFPTQGIRDIDDWELISDVSKGMRIKKLTLYADYYIWAIEITYIDLQDKEFNSVHALDDSYLSKKDFIKKAELEIDENDYIEFISCAYSSQKTFIRSITISTHSKLLLVLEGEIELKNKEIQELISSKHSIGSIGSQSNKSRMNKNVSKSAIWDAKGKSGQDKMNVLCNSNAKSQGPDSDKEEEEDENKSEITDYESSFSLKKPSLVDFYLKTQSWNLAQLNLKVVGLKTYFNGYIEDIEVYAEPIEFENSTINKGAKASIESSEH